MIYLRKVYGLLQWNKIREDFEYLFCNDEISKIVVDAKTVYVWMDFRAMIRSHNYDLIMEEGGNVLSADVVKNGMGALRFLNIKTETMSHSLRCETDYRDSTFYQSSLQNFKIVKLNYEADLINYRLYFDV